MNPTYTESMPIFVANLNAEIKLLQNIHTQQQRQSGEVKNSRVSMSSD
jgi:hypothetical protein